MSNFTVPTLGQSPERTMKLNQGTKCDIKNDRKAKLLEARRKKITKSDVCDSIHGELDYFHFRESKIEFCSRED